MKIIVLFIFILSIIQLIKCQQIENIYINSLSGNDDSGNGSITKPYQTICKLNRVLNNISQPTIIINIAYGEYYNSSQPCIIEIININNISIIPYNSNNNNDQVLIKYINFNIIRSNLIIKNININVGNEEIKSNVLNVGLTIQDSSVILNNVLFNLTSYKDKQAEYESMIINSNFTIINNSQLIFNQFNRDISIDDSNIKSSNSTFICSSFINLSSGKYTISNDDNSKCIDCLFNLYYGEITIINSVLFSTFNNNDNIHLDIGYSIIIIKNSTIESIVQTILSEPLLSGGNGNIILLENVVISGFKNSVSLLSLRSGSLEINQITFINCQYNTLISILVSPQPLTQYYKFNISIDGLNLVNNKYSKFIDIASTSLNISITNIVSKCNGEYNIPSFVTINYRGYSNIIKSLLSIKNSNLECFGPSLFKNSIVKFENTTFSRNTFTNNFITLSDTTEFSLVSSTLYSIYNMVENKGHFINLNSNSSIVVSNCILSQFSTSFINANYYSIVSIVDSMILNSKSNFIPFINIDKSELQISNIIVNQYYTLNASLINLVNNSTCTMNLINISQSWFDFGYIYNSIGSHTTISTMNLNECFSQLALFFHFNNYLEITNSTFTNNNNIGSGVIMFLFDQIDEVKMINCTFYSNSFSPYIDSFNSHNAVYNGIIFQRNSGSFYMGSNDVFIVFSNFQMINNDKIPLEYLISLTDTINGTLDNFYLVNNYFSKYLVHSNHSKLVINDFQYINNTITNNLNYLTSFTPFSKKNEPIAQFLIDFNSRCTISNFIGIGNIFSSNLFYILESFVTIVNSTLTNNKLQYQSALVQSIESNLHIINSELNENKELYSNSFGKGLIYQENGNLLIDGCTMNGNYFLMSKGCVFNINTFAGERSEYFIYNSQFNSNIGNFGGVIYIDSDYRKSNFQLLNNSFTNNFGKGGGGVLYTSNFALSNDGHVTLMINNTFINNTCCMNNIGNDFSSLLNTAFSNTSTTIYHESQLIEYVFIDYYNQTVMDIYGELPIIITCDNSSVHSFNLSLVIGGQGSFYWDNKNNCTKSMLIQIMINQIQFSLIYDIYGCPQYKYLNTSINQCEYCQIGWTLPSNSENENDCYHCDPEKQSCIESSVYAFNGYYLDDKPIECAIDMCKEGNQCPSKFYSGILCYHCFDSNGNGVVTKNGIQCCYQFKPLLIIPIIILFIATSLLLSVGKYLLISNQYAYIGSIIMYAQINSVVFFSYSGIYFLPLFRFSIDMLDGYCLWSWLNYNYKSLFIYTIIVCSFLISCSDITLLIVNRYYYPIIKKILPNSSLSIKSKFIKRLNIKITCNNGNSGIGSWFNQYRMKSIWALFQLFLIPLLFNSISLITIKKDLDLYYLIVDFSIVYLKESISKLTFSISIISLLLVSGLLVFSIADTSFNFKSSKLKNFKSVFYNSNYNNNNFVRYNWDYIIMIKSYLFISLSLAMIFNSSYYLVTILVIQIVYTCTHFLINPFKKQVSNLYMTNNLINLLQLILFVFAGTTLFQLIDPPHYKGIIITCCSFSTIIIVSFYNYFLKFKI